MNFFKVLLVKTFLCLVFSFPFLLFAQKDSAKVNLISADVLEFNKSISPDYQILSGSVVFEYDGSLLYCDKANIYIKKDLVVCHGNVHIIINDTTHMYGDTLKINGDQDLAEMINNVKLIDNEMTLTTDRLFYDLKKDVAYYLTGGEITDPKNYLTSEKGYYYQKDRQFYFSDSVYIKNKDTEMFSDTLMYNTRTEITHFYGKTRIIQPDNQMFCEKGTYDTKSDIGHFKTNVELYSGSRILKSDSLYYNKSIQFSEAFVNVVFSDTAENIFISGQYGRFLESDSTFFITDSALLKMADKGDTLYLHADSIFMVNDTLIHMQKIIHAQFKARMWRHDFQSVSDSIVYLTGDSVMYLYHDPIVWMDNTQLIADTIYITYLEGDLDKLHMRSNAFIVSQESTSDFQQIKSINMEGFFVDNELDLLYARENAQTIYYLFDEKMRLIGINIAKSEDMTIRFENNEASKITFLTQPEGTLNPEESVSDSQKQLEEFRWEQSIRPKHHKDVFRDPAIQPEADELIPDSAITMATDSLITDSVNSTDSTEILHTDPKEGGRGKQKNKDRSD
jgi:lipopolysaccharide export system protein LptA